MLDWPAGAGAEAAGAGHGGTFLGACASAGTASAPSANAPNAMKTRVLALMASAPAGEDCELLRTSLQRSSPDRARENPRVRRNRHLPQPAVPLPRLTPRIRRTESQRLPPTRRRGPRPPLRRDVRLQPVVLRTSHSPRLVRQRALH